MKKLISLIASMVLCMALVIPVSGASGSTIGEGTSGVTSQTVYAKVVDNTTTVYSIEIAWSAMYFRYDMSLGTWNPSTLRYDTQNPDQWVAVNADGTDFTNPFTQTTYNHYVKVTNRSNAAIKATLATSLEGGIIPQDSMTLPMHTMLYNPNDTDYLSAGVTVPEGQNSTQTFTGGSNFTFGLASAINPDGSGQNAAVSVMTLVGMKNDPTSSYSDEVIEQLKSGYQNVGKVTVNLEAWDGTSSLS